MQEQLDGGTPGGGWEVSGYLLPPKPDKPLKKRLQVRDSAGSSGQAPEDGYDGQRAWVAGQLTQVPWSKWLAMVAAVQASRHNTLWSCVRAAIQWRRSAVW